MKKTAGNYSKWGYICILPFLVGYAMFSLIPLVMTVVNSFYENYRQGLVQVGPTFVGLDNFIDLLSGGDIWVYLQNTIIMWLMGFVPQILTNGSGNPVRSSMTLLMFLNRHLFSKNYGAAGAVSVLIFIVTGVLSLGIFKITEEKEG